jgi:L-asparaginase
LRIRVIITGGTFDKDYDALGGTLTFRDTHLPDILKYTRCTVPIEIELNQLIDSLEMRTPNRMRILDACRRAEETHIVVTHGTDTMVETAQVLGKAAMEKTIVLTGSMVPYAFTHSDAVFNLGAAITAVQLLPRGVFIAMNGRTFPWNDVRKNRNLGTFEAKIT